MPAVLPPRCRASSGKCLLWYLAFFANYTSRPAEILLKQLIRFLHSNNARTKRRHHLTSHNMACRYPTTWPQTTYWWRHCTLRMMAVHTLLSNPPLWFRHNTGCPFVLWDQSLPDSTYLAIIQTFLWRSLRNAITRAVTHKTFRTCKIKQNERHGKHLLCSTPARLQRLFSAAPLQQIVKKMGGAYANYFCSCVRDVMRDVRGHSHHRATRRDWLQQFCLANIIRRKTL